ncbi:hypothetical protein A3B51_01590 [Candidatus Curtissbacteria bacterium RIFCSPLOWO2_01_FULL_41_18]|uniref:Uncharacterized protein n=2 Tax=Candidatus Curtissiibacteriota TaxID=1752717 RepID=A0A1F5G250_9BACT|nr:MAG: hypothetical protein A2696_04215 [Candidatus Curtissbacteria bacterium RIFCSPHIGHO2_01_FULL_41_13]OGE05387.1 MAG: hypothetical protein A3B51_01590 [Candidatus Curtissbacteria bacterium RIFCSPLOWO2_01_FULL_41_18]
MSRYSPEEKRDKFRKIAARRTDVVLEKLRILSNCANTQLYSYNDDEVRKIFKAVDDQLNIVKARFQKKRRDKFNWE